VILILTDVLLINLGRTSGAEVNDLNFLKSFRLKHGEEAVSPVVGVMLMLVVTIIIAAVVSAFAGGLGTTKQAAPSLGMDIAIANSGQAATSYIRFDVQSVSTPINTANLKIITSWTSESGVSGGNTTELGLNSPNVYTDDTWNYCSYGWPAPCSGTTLDQHQAPVGFGAGINGTQLSAGSIEPNQWFGNYTLEPGTSMQEAPDFVTYGASSSYAYNSEPAGWVDGMQAVLGGNWNALRPGDTVHINIIDTKSGETILSKDVEVTSA